MKINPVQQRSRNSIQILFNCSGCTYAFLVRMVIEATHAWVRCIVVNARFKARKPVNPALPAILETIGDHLRKKRLDMGLSQPEVAKLLKVTTDTVTLWELNRNSPTARYFKKILAFLGYLPDLGYGKSLGERLKIARQIMGHTQRQAAAKMKCDCSNIRYIELNARKPQAVTNQKIERYIREALEKVSLR